MNIILDQIDTKMEVLELGGILQIIENGEVVALNIVEEIAQQIHVEYNDVSLQVFDDAEIRFISINEKGQKGESGESAYQNAVRNGYVGTEADWNKYLRPDFLNELGDFSVNYKDMFLARLNK